MMRPVTPEFRNGAPASALRLLSQDKAHEPVVAAAAKEGCLAAQIMLGLAHLEGRGVEKNDRAAYHWFRLAEMNSARALNQSRRGVEEIKSRLQAHDIEELEQQVSLELQAKPNPKLQPACEQLRPELTMIAKLAS